MGMWKTTSFDHQDLCVQTLILVEYVQQLEILMEPKNKNHGQLVYSDFLFCTMVNHHSTTIWDNIFGTFSKHLIPGRSFGICRFSKTFLPTHTAPLSAGSRSEPWSLNMAKTDLPGDSSSRLDVW